MRRHSQRQNLASSSISLAIHGGAPDALANSSALALPENAILIAPVITRSSITTRMAIPTDRSHHLGNTSVELPIDRGGKTVRRGRQQRQEQHEPVAPHQGKRAERDFGGHRVQSSILSIGISAKSPTLVVTKVTFKAIACAAIKRSKELRRNGSAA